MTGREWLTAAATDGPEEAAVSRSWLTAATQWTGRVRGRVMAPFRQGRSMPDPAMVLSLGGVWVEELNQNVRPTVLEVLRRSYARAFGAPPPPGFDQSTYTQQYLTASVNRMSGIPEEVYRRIAAVISDGVAANESIPDIARRVDEVLTVTGSEQWENRSVVVARTEVGSAVNAGTLAAAGQRQNDTGRPMVKEWMATIHGETAGTTRPAHRLADGQTVPLTSPFTVGGELLQYPGDPSGSAGNVINCRCTITTRAADER